MAYDFTGIEKKWQRYWLENKTFAALDPQEAGDMPVSYVLDMFPYPSGAGLHVGHPEGYTATDIVSRYLRMRGHNVMHPMGWDAFGLPAEQHAIKSNEHPGIITKKSIARFKEQLMMLGLSYDWDREVDTTNPRYYKWTQWIFLQLFNSYFDPIEKKAKPISHLINELGNDNYTVGPDGSIQLSRSAEGLRAITGEVGLERHWHELSSQDQRDVIDSQRLAYMDEVPVNWCPGLGTVLANEEVIDGKSEVGGFPVERRPMRQWMLRITSYADRLLDDLDQLQWTESLKEMQRNWIGKSEGAEIDFEIAPGAPDAPDAPDAGRAATGVEEEELYITVFTTRPDTIFGATYMVLAPEHPLVDRITPDSHRETIEAYRTQVAAKSERERLADAKEKTGVFTGAFAINPANQKKIPIYIADYVLMGYGTGAIMAVPGQDQRDWDFAKKFDLPIVRTVQPPANFPDEPYLGDGPAINSDFLNGMNVADAKERMIEFLENEGAGVRSTKYKLRDWLFSRQRYWGEPFPILLDDEGNAYAVDESELPVTLPELADFKPTGTPEGPLSKAPASWLKVVRDGKTFTRETNTMPQWAGSCWYYLRYLDPKNDQRFVDPAKEKYWMPVDLYVGGVEHAVLHLLYARFWHKVLFDLGQVSTPEPFMRLVNQGTILGEDNQKMSKSRGNVVNPDDVVRDFGADTFRLYEMYMGPLEASKPWNTRDIVGMQRFLNSVWRNLIGDELDPNSRDATRRAPVIDHAPIPEALERQMHRTIKKVGEDIELLRFNTAIAELIKLNNEITTPHSSSQAGMESVPRDLAENLVLMLAPFAPHTCEEIWSRLGHTKSLTRRPWPSFDPAKLEESTIELAIQVNGKVRDKLTVPADADEATILKQAEQLPKLQTWIAGKSIKKRLYVPKKLVNFVVA